MNRNLKLIFPLLIIIPATGFSQYKLIKDKDADFALIGVNIYSGQNGVTTDSNGICNFEIFNDLFHLCIIDGSSSQIQSPCNVLCITIYRFVYNVP